MPRKSGAQRGRNRYRSDRSANRSRGQANARSSSPVQIRPGRLGSQSARGNGAFVGRPRFKPRKPFRTESKQKAKTRSLYCTFTAPIRKCLIISGAGEGNRTLVIITKAHFQGNALYQPGIPRKFHYCAPFFWAHSERVTTAYHSVSLGNLPALPGRTAMREVVPWSSLLVGNIIL